MNAGDRGQLKILARTISQVPPLFASRNPPLPLPSLSPWGATQRELGEDGEMAALF